MAKDLSIININNEINEVLEMINSDNLLCDSYKEPELLPVQSEIYQLEAKDVVDGIKIKEGRKRKGSLDYSLDCEYMYGVYPECFYQKEDNGKIKQYTDEVISVTFNYGYKVYKEYFYNSIIKTKGRNKKKADMRKIYIHHTIKEKDYKKFDYSKGIVFSNTLHAIVISNKKENFPILSKEEMNKIESILLTVKGFSLVLDEDENGETVGYHFEVNTSKLQQLHDTKELRKILYERGFDCNGKHFVRFKRSGGSARVGKCLFISEDMASSMEKWALMELDIKEGDETDLASLEAYISLTSSGIIDKMSIKPNEILVVKDYESVFSEECIVTEIENGKLVTNKKVAEIKNSIFDGESMMDESKFEEYGYEDKGVLLTRNRFWKSACFNCGVQRFFADNNITLDDIKNSEAYIYTLAKDISEIKLITTPSSIKFVKFGKIDDWFDRVDDTFGIVKYDKPTHFLDGHLVQSHYQLINTLQFTDEEMKEFLQPTLDYIKLLKDNPAVFRKHIKASTELNEEMYDNSTQSFIYYMIGANNDFTKTSMYKEFVKDTVRAFKDNAKQGHILIEGNYSVLCGNPIEMLKWTCGIWDKQSCIGIDKACSIRFDDKESLLGTRSPHVASGNIWLLENDKNKEILKYMNATPQILYVNSINNNLLMRLSGADFDIDSIALTNNKILIDVASKNYDRFLVPTNNASAKKVKRKFEHEDKNDLDIKTGKNKIGEIVNLSQVLNSLMFDLLNTQGNGIIKCKKEEIDSIVEKLYIDACALSNMSGIEIDSAKKEFDINMSAELDEIRDRWLIKDTGVLNGKTKEKTILPLFFKNVKEKTSQKNYLFREYKTSMDMLQKYLKPEYIYYDDIIPLNKIFKGITKDNKPNYKNIESVINIVNDTDKLLKGFFNDDLSYDEIKIIKSGIRKKEIKNLKEIIIEPQDICFIINKISKIKNKLKDNRNEKDKKYLKCERRLLALLFNVYKNEFIDVLLKQKQNTSIISETKNNKNLILLYNHKYYIN